MAKLRSDTRKGDRLKSLKNLANILAAKIDLINEDEDIQSIQLLSQLSRQYRDTMREIEEIGGMDKNDDEIGEILSARKADGKSDSVR